VRNAFGLRHIVTRFRGNAALRRLLVITKPYVTYVRLTWGNAYTLFPTNLAVNRQTKVLATSAEKD